MVDSRTRTPDRCQPQCQRRRRELVSPWHALPRIRRSAAHSTFTFTKVYPYEAGGVGTPIAEFLAGKAALGRITPPPQTVFHEGSGKVMNTIPPNDWTFFEILNEIVQREPATSLDPELMVRWPQWVS
jgi:hypothetical protein